MKWEHVMDIIPLLDVCFLFNSQSEGDVPFPLNTTGVLSENIVPVDRSIKAVITQPPARSLHPSLGINIFSVD